MLRLDSKKSFWYLVSLAIILFILRIPSLFEGWWYGDENIYMAIGQTITRGGWLYLDAWDHKPPMIYLIYAFSYWVFGPWLWPLRLLNVLLSIVGIIAFYLVSRKIFDFSEKNSAISTSIFTVLLAVFFEGSIFNAENIFMPLIWTGFLLIAYQLKQINKQKLDFRWLILGTFLWSIAIFTKVHAAVEVAVLSFCLIVYYVSLKNSRDPKNAKNQQGKLYNPSGKKVLELIKRTITEKRFWQIFGNIGLVVFLPYILTVLIYGWKGNFYDLYFAILDYNKVYINSPNSVILFGYTIEWLSGIKLRLFLLVITMITSGWLFLTKQINIKWFWLTNWLAVAMFSSLISERNYPHYFLQVLPVLVLAGGVLLEKINCNYTSLAQKLKDGLLGLLILQIFMSNFSVGNLMFNSHSSEVYFIDFLRFVAGQKTKREWQEGYNQHLITTQPRMVEIIQTHTKPDDKIFIVANRPDLYFLSQRQNGQKFVVDYHFEDSQVSQVFAELIQNNTKLVILDRESSRSEKIQSLLIDQGFVVVDSAFDRYDFWLFL